MELEVLCFWFISPKGVTTLTMNVYIAFFLALGIGTTPVVWMFVGADDGENVNHAVKQSLIMGIIIGLGFGLVNLILGKQTLLLLSAEDRVIQYALPCFLVVAVPSVFLSVNMLLASALRGAGDIFIIDRYLRHKGFGCIYFEYQIRLWTGWGLDH